MSMHNQSDENPYSSPLEIESVGAAAEVVPYVSGSAPWLGWGVAIGMVSAVAIILLSSILLTQEFWMVTVVLPFLGLAALAVGVRYCHKTVMIQWGLYLLVSVAFGAASYVCFVPVCFVVGIPAALLTASLPQGAIVVLSAVAGFLMVALTGLIFVAFLRLYFNSRYRAQLIEQVVLDAQEQQWSQQLLSSPPKKD